MSVVAQKYAGDVVVGDAVSELVVRPTPITLFRMSAVTWNAHRIHYDQAYARSEGYADVLVHAHLHGAWLSQAVLAWAGPLARLREIGWQNRHAAVVGTTLRCTGTVVAVDGTLVELELEERDDDGNVCAPGRAVVALPVRGGGA